MKRPSRLPGIVLRAARVPHVQHSTIRTRIALVYGGVFLVLGTALLATVNLASRAGTDSQARAIARTAAVVQPGYAVNGPLVTRRTLGPPTVYDLTDHVSDAAGHQLLIWSVAALLVMTACAVAVGWWTAGRVLRPVHAMTAKARLLSEHTLHERIASTGPDDELKELGDTLDALLARLEKAFDSQRRFIANASHELRTPSPPSGPRSRSVWTTRPRRISYGPGRRSWTTTGAASGSSRGCWSWRAANADSRRASGTRWTSRRWWRRRRRGTRV